MISLHPRTAVYSPASARTHRAQIAFRSCPTAALRQRRQTGRENRMSVVTRGLFGLGLPEIAVVAGVTALIFGKIGKELGKTVKSFQTAAKEFETELKNAAEDDEEVKAKLPENDKKF